MPRRSTLNRSGPRNYTAPAHEFGSRPNNTVLNRLRVRRDAAATSNTPSAQGYYPTNNLSGSLNDIYPAADLHQLRVRRNAAASNITSNGTISTNSGSMPFSGIIFGFGLVGALSLIALALVLGIVAAHSGNPAEQEDALRTHPRDVDNSAIPLINIRSPGIEPLSPFGEPPPYETLSNIPAAGVTTVCLDAEPPPSYESIYPSAIQ